MTGICKSTLDMPVQGTADQCCPDTWGLATVTPSPPVLMGQQGHMSCSGLSTHSGQSETHCLTRVFWTKEAPLCATACWSYQEHGCRWERCDPFCNSATAAGSSSQEGIKQKAPTAKPHTPSQRQTRRLCRGQSFVAAFLTVTAPLPRHGSPSSGSGRGERTWGENAGRTREDAQPPPPPR